MTTVTDRRVEAWAAHIADRHQCCRIVTGEQCGLWCGHQGDHLPYTPGDYLPDPVLHPLALLRLRTAWPATMRCPVCGMSGDQRGGGIGVEMSSGEISRQVGDEARLSVEARWSFRPCGCVGREILPD